MEEMTKQDALAILTQLAEGYKGTLNEHRTLQRALEVLTPKEKPVKQ